MLENKETKSAEVSLGSILNEGNRQIEQLQQQKSKVGALVIKSANQWMQEASERPIPKKLFDVLWHEGEIGILFANTGAGKSILAVQIADSISRGEPIPEFQLETEPQKVLYFDFELSDKQFEKRYSEEYQNHYLFHENLLRVEWNIEAEQPEVSNEDYLIPSIEQAILKHNSKVLIIDNLTYLRQDNEKAKDALPLMKQLKELKTKYDLSILVLAHTPKRPAGTPITKDDLAGSKMLMNFCDSSFTIGESLQQPGVRYIKQIKERATDKVFGEENVVLCRLVKPTNFLHFEVLEKHVNEHLHLKRTVESTNEEMQQLMQMKQQGMSNVAIGKILGISEGAVRKRLDKVVPLVPFAPIPDGTNGMSNETEEESWLF